MTTLAALLILGSVSLHLSWNAISKQADPTPAFFLIASAVSSLALSPALFWYRDVAGEAFHLVLPLLATVAVFSATYNILLARAYRSADLSLIYPLARSLGPAGVLLVSFALGRGGEISVGCALGIVAIIAGSIFLPLDSIASLRLSNYRTPAFLAAIGCAGATVGYTLIDDQALRFLRNDPGLGTGLGTGELSLLYASMEAPATTLVLGAFVLARRSERQKLPRVAHSSGRAALTVGILGYGSYILILWSMAYVTDVTYVAGFRQIGVPLSLLAGARILGERITGPRLLGGGLCSFGLLLIGLF